MENKYFTPDIEDFYIGYEYERFVPRANATEEECWEKLVMSVNYLSLDDIDNEIMEKEIRVPYLTKEQIEAEGWKFDYNLGDFDYYIKTVNDKEEYELEFCYKERININIWKRTLYHGECKDINTFRKIIKLLGI